MLSVQLGSALSVPLVRTLGAAGLAWLRLTMGALVFIAIARPPLRSLQRSDTGLVVALGIVNGVVTIAFLGAIQHLPLGTAVSIEFLGPLGVAAMTSRTRRALIWPAMALGGVLLLTEPWHGRIEAPGIAWALTAAIGWGSYIVLTQRAGDRFEGIAALSLTAPISALTAAVFGLGQALGHLTIKNLAAAFGLALLLPVLPYALEMMALRRMTRSAFGTFMAIEPALGLLIGIVVLGQHPGALQIVGIVVVVFAGAFAQRGGSRADLDPVFASAFEGE